MHQVYIGIGSNLDDPLNQVKTALEELKRHAKFKLLACSSIYKSKALITSKNTRQPDYINAVVKLETNSNPNELLSLLQEIEKQHNKVQQYHWGPRTLDLDILLFDDLSIASPTLTIPHSEIAKRDFVLFPLFDIDPLLDIPELGKLKPLVEKHSKENLQLIESLTDLK